MSRKLDPMKQLWWPGDILELGKGESKYFLLVHTVCIARAKKKSHVQYQCLRLTENTYQVSGGRWVINNFTYVYKISNNNLGGANQVKVIQRGDYLKPLEKFLEVIDSLKDVFQDTSSLGIPELPRIGGKGYIKRSLVYEKGCPKIIKAIMPESVISMSLFTPNYSEWSSGDLETRDNYRVDINYNSSCSSSTPLENTGDFTDKEKVCDFCKRFDIQRCLECQISEVWIGWKKL